MFFAHPSSEGEESEEVTRERFTGVAPVFPLGSLTLLPNVVQPFHLFEPRYRQMGEDVVEGDGFLSFAVLRPGPGAAADYEKKSADIFRHVCVGQVMQYEPLPDGRWNLIVRGLWRAEIAEELVEERPYRRAKLDVLPEQPAEAASDLDVASHRDTLLELFHRAQPQLAEMSIVKSILERDMPLGLLVDFLAHALELSPGSGAALLAEPCAARRCQFLTAMLQAFVRRRDKNDRPFPPEFSVN